MSNSKPAKRRWPIFTLALMSVALPACHGDGQRVDQTRTAYKPVPTTLRGRAFYVGGYGGADYSPGRARPGIQSAADADYSSSVDTPAVDAPTVSIRQGTWDEP